MLSELIVDMKSAAVCHAFPADATALQIWGISVSEILHRVLDKARELGYAYRDQIEQAAKEAVDALVDLDIPGVPGIIEDAIDSATLSLGYGAITAILNAVLPQGEEK